MGDYTPVALPGQTYSLTTSTAVVGGDLVEITGANTVGKVGTASDRAYVGVANHDAASGTKVTVTLGKPIHESVADGSIAAGDQLTTTSTANRQVKTLAAAAVDVTGTPSQTTINTAINTSVNNARAVIGFALTSAADNALVRWISE